MLILKANINANQMMNSNINKCDVSLHYFSINVNFAHINKIKSTLYKLEYSVLRSTDSSCGSVY